MADTKRSLMRRALAINRLIPVCMKRKYLDVLTAFLLAALPASAQLSVVNADRALKTFGTMGKEVTPLSREKEAELFRHEGKGCLTHMWFGGGWKGCDKTRIRIYVDGETNASIDMELYLGHGIGFGDESAPVSYTHLTLPTNREV